MGIYRSSFLSGFVCCLVLLSVGCDEAPTVQQQTFPAPERKTTVRLGNGVSLKLIYVPAGKYRMGSIDTDSSRQPDEAPHTVTITRGFYLGATEVTQAQWRAVMSGNPSFLWGAERPLEHVSWEQAGEFCSALTEATGMSFRLPTEAEWEYACRAGSASRFCFGDDADRLGDYAWCQSNAGAGKTHPVAGRRPNAWGFYDMHGNVREWCQDWYGAYPAEADTDPTGPSSGQERVLRGGSWGYVASLCRSASREARPPDHRGGYVGIRVAAGLPGDISQSYQPLPRTK